MLHPDTICSGLFLRFEGSTALQPLSATHEAHKPNALTPRVTETPELRCMPHADDRSDASAYVG